MNLYVTCPSDALSPNLPSTQGVCGSFAAPGRTFSFIETNYPGSSFTVGSFVAVTLILAGGGTVSSVSATLTDSNSGQTLAMGSTQQTTVLNASDCGHASFVVFTMPTESGIVVKSGDGLNLTEHITTGPTMAGIVCSGPSAPTGVQISTSGATGSSITTTANSATSTSSSSVTTSTGLSSSTSSGTSSGSTSPQASSDLTYVLILVAIAAIGIGVYLFRGKIRKKKEGGTDIPPPLVASTGPCGPEEIAKIRAECLKLAKEASVKEREFQRTADSLQADADNINADIRSLNKDIQAFESDVGDFNSDETDYENSLAQNQEENQGRATVGLTRTQKELDTRFSELSDRLSGLNSRSFKLSNARQRNLDAQGKLRNDLEDFINELRKLLPLPCKVPCQELENVISRAEALKKSVDWGIDSVSPIPDLPNPVPPAPVPPTPPDVGKDLIPSTTGTPSTQERKKSEPVESFRWAVEELNLACDDTNPLFGWFDFIVSIQALSANHKPVAAVYTEVEPTADGTSSQDGGNLLFYGTQSSLEAAKASGSLPASSPLSYLTPFYNGVGGADTDSQGRVYCHMRIPIPGGSQASDLASSSFGSLVPGFIGLMAMAYDDSTLPGDIQPDGGETATNVDEKPNIFVRAKQALVETVAKLEAGVKVGYARIPDRKGIFRWTYDRYIDSVITTYFPGPLYQQFLSNSGISDSEFRAGVGGIIIGIPKGVFNNIKGIIQNFEFFVYDAPKAFLELIAREVKDDPSILVKLTSTSGLMQIMAEYSVKKGIQAYAFIKQNKDKISEFFQTVKKSTPDFDLLGTVDKLLGYVYGTFEANVRETAQILGYDKGTTEWSIFVSGFIAGNVTGYLLFEAALQAVYGLLSDGALNLLSILGKFGKVGQTLLNVALKVGSIVLEVSEAVGELISIVSRYATLVGGKLLDTMAHLVGKGTEAVVGVFIGILGFLGNLGETTVKAFYRLVQKAASKLDDLILRFVKFAANYFEGATSRILWCWEGVYDVVQDGLMLADQVADKVYDVVIKTFNFLSVISERSGLLIGQAKAFAGDWLRDAVKACSLIIRLTTDDFLMEMSQHVEKDNQEDINEIEDGLQGIGVDSNLVNDGMASDLSILEPPAISRDEYLKDCFMGMREFLHDYRREAGVPE